MNHTKELLSIELSNLVPSPFTVRRHPTSQVEELAALIAAQGLLHNLAVTEQMVGRSRARKVRSWRGCAAGRGRSADDRHVLVAGVAAAQNPWVI